MIFHDLSCWGTLQMRGKMLMTLMTPWRAVGQSADFFLGDSIVYSGQPLFDHGGMYWMHIECILNASVWDFMRCFCCLFIFFYHWFHLAIVKMANFPSAGQPLLTSWWSRQFPPMFSVFFLRGTIVIHLENWLLVAEKIWLSGILLYHY